MQKVFTLFPACRAARLKADAPKIVIGAAMLLMALEPMRWLAESWRDPAYDSKGLWVFALCLGFSGWSLSSACIRHDTADQSRGYRLLMLTAAVRAAGQLLAVNIIGALALVADVYALGLLAGLKNRRQALSPGWLALLFAFSLPLERVLQRLCGYGLQQISAAGACGALKLMSPGVLCHGTRILIEGHDVLVDLPCSGVRMLIFLCILYAASMALARPPFYRAIALGAATLGIALAANAARIAVLCILIAYPLPHVDAMAAPWHDMIGLFFLALAALPVALMAARAAPLHRPAAAAGDARPTAFRQNLLSALVFLLLAMLIVALPRKPVDIGTASTRVSLPMSIDGNYGTPVALSDREKAYFTQYGGSALKTAYGRNSVMLIATGSPLRHLHAPDDCLRGMGFGVRYAGIRQAPLPTALYVATAPDGTQWRIAVTFYADNGETANNVAEAIWRWMQYPHTSWHALQRITPLDTPEAEALRWDNAVFAALDLSRLPATPRPIQEISHAENH